MPRSENKVIWEEAWSQVSVLLMSLFFFICPVQKEDGPEYNFNTPEGFKVLGQGKLGLVCCSLIAVSDRLNLQDMSFHAL